jgi:uncharacterized protein YecE (DUF72 family)
MNRLCGHADAAAPTWWPSSTVVPAAAEPGGWNGLAYYGLHWSPQMYHSAHSAEYFSALPPRPTLRAEAAPVWCIFDNTVLGAATTNALNRLGRPRSA